MRVLITMHAVAAWGGLHENVYFSALALKRAGHIVDVACSGERLADVLLVQGISVIALHNGESSDQAATRISSARQYDLVYCQPFIAREIGFRVSRLQKIPIVAAFHGNYLDALETWYDEAAFVTAVSPALTKKLESSVVSSGGNFVTIRNGIEDNLFTFPLLSLDEKLRSSHGFVEIAILARLDADKQPLWTAAMEALDILSRTFPALEWRVSVLGSGGSENQLSESFGEFIVAHPNVSVKWLGWISMEEVPRMLSGCILSFASGRGAGQSLAVGTPCIAAGSQGSYGLQTGSRLKLGLWGNFGGYPLSTEEEISGSSEDVVELFTNITAYSKAQFEGRSVAWSFLRQSKLDGELIDVLERAVNFNL